MMKVMAIAAFVCLIGAIFSKDACGYIDLGTGSYLIQLAIATIIGGLFTVKVFWAGIKEFFKKGPFKGRRR